MKLRHPAIWLGFVPLWIAFAALAWHVEGDIHRTPREVMRGSSSYLPSGKTQQQLADEVAGAVEAIRSVGTEPQRYLFDLPQEWAPPADWTPPEGWNPPTWWPR